MDFKSAFVERKKESLNLDFMGFVDQNSTQNQMS